MKQNLILSHYNSQLLPNNVFGSNNLPKLKKLRGVSNIHLFISDGVSPENVLEEPLGPHARLGLPSKTGHGLNTLKKDWTS